MKKTPAVYQPTAIVIFGGTGNLAETKLLPSLFDLYVNQMLPDSFTIIGLSRKDISHKEYQSFVKKSIEAKIEVKDEQQLADFCSRVRYAAGSFDDMASYNRVKDLLTEFDTELGQCTSKLFYLAVPPSLYSGIFEKLKESDAMALCDEVDSWSRLLVEKPFGSDLETAEALEQQLCQLFAENQIYRIDHYLAKGTIENIISLRFANSILSDSWNGSQIESIDIKLFEGQDVSTRGSFYDGIGTLRDVGQNHMLQMLALLTMKPANVHSAEEMRTGRLEALQALSMHDDDLCVRGQYKGYRETGGVNPESKTETYFKIRTHIDTELWKDVQVTLESGKALTKSFTEATVTFRSTDLCSCDADLAGHKHNNVLRITFSPEQSIKLTMWIKEPGFDFKLHERELVLSEYTGELFRSPEAYERVLHDCIIGDQTRFVSGDEVRAAWEFITPILKSFKELPLLQYEKGSVPVISESK
ncbi:MAG: glucose-6-phosphate dehydrogenase [Candidatus Pacebacteria bacterium]|nr:glucose-6-phosphate dehydrogenase [Candidatus Paceibacterota bacterium]